jgi:hypothetical protein
MVLFVVIFWMIQLTIRFRGFDQDARGFDVIMRKMEKNKSVLALTYDRGSKSVPCIPFYHFVAWYQVEKGGILAYSIAYLYNVAAQYKPGREMLPLSKAGPIWSNPDFMNWEDYGGFDYYVLRTVSEKPKSILESSNDKVQLIAKEGYWWLYKKV